MRWLRTPWEHAARVRGAGVDCAQFLIAVFSSVGLIDDFKPPAYAIDWHLHRGNPLFMDQLLARSLKIITPLPGDIAMFRYGRQPAHGSIVTSVVDFSPVIIHAWRDEGMVTMTDLSVSPLAKRLYGYYRLRSFN